MSVPQNQAPTPPPDPNTPTPPERFPLAVRRRIASAVTLVLVVAITWQVIGRMFVVFWVSVPWWGFLLIIVGLFLLIDHLVSKVLA